MKRIEERKRGIELAILILSIVGSALGNFFVYFYMKTAESYFPYTKEAYLLSTIIIGVVFFGLIIWILRDVKKLLK